jgi:uncharacterized protein
LSSIYIESSAMLAWLFDEPGAAEVAAAVDEATTVATSLLTLVEGRRAVARGVGEKRISQAAARSHLALLSRWNAQWAIIPLTDGILERAGRGFPSEPVKTLDAIHLASARLFADSVPGAKLLSFDRRIIANAVPLGLPIAP